MIRTLFKWLFRIIVVAFVVLYPMMISIYVTLPLFIGYAGYIFVLGLEGRGGRYIIFSLLYLLNLEINLSLPLLATLLAVLVFYHFVYPALDLIKRCEVCIALIAVSSIDIFYFLLILGYDFIFDTSSIAVNSLLYYSLIIDMLAAVLI